MLICANYLCKGQQYARGIQLCFRKNFLSTSTRRTQVLYTVGQSARRALKTPSLKTFSRDTGFSSKFETVHFYVLTSPAKVPSLNQILKRVQTQKLKTKPSYAEITNYVCDHQGRPSALPSSGSQRPSLGGTFADATSAWPSHRPRAPAGGDRLKGTVSCSASLPFIQIRYFSVMYFSPMDPGAHPSSTWAGSPPVTT